MNMRPTDVDYAIQLLYRLKAVCHEPESEGKTKRAMHLITHVVDCMDMLCEFSNEPCRYRKNQSGHTVRITTDPHTDHTQEN